MVRSTPGGTTMAERRNLRPLLIGAGLSVIVVALALTLFGGRSSASTMATLDIIEGSATVTPKPGAQSHDAQENESLREGATIETAARSLVSITYFDGSFTRIGPSTRYHLVELKRPTGAKVIVGKLDVGETFHDVKKLTGSESRFEVQTSHAVAGVRGTRFVARCLPPLPCGYAVIEGMLEVRSVDGTVRIVNAGERVTIGDNGLLSELLLISKDDPWVNRNLFLDTPGATTTTLEPDTTESTAAGASDSTDASGAAEPAGGTLQSTTTMAQIGPNTTAGRSATTTTTRRGATTTAASIKPTTTTTRPPSTTVPPQSSTTTPNPPSTNTTSPPQSSTTTPNPPSTNTTAPPASTTTVPPNTTTTRPATTTTRPSSTTTPNNPGAASGDPNRTNGGSVPAEPWIWVLAMAGGVAWVSRHADQYDD